MKITKNPDIRLNPNRQNKYIDEKQAMLKAIKNLQKGDDLLISFDSEQKAMKQTLYGFARSYVSRGAFYPKHITISNSKIGIYIKRVKDIQKGGEE